MEPTTFEFVAGLTAILAALGGGFRWGVNRLTTAIKEAEQRGQEAATVKVEGERVAIEKDGSAVTGYKDLTDDLNAQLELTRKELDQTRAEVSLLRDKVAETQAAMSSMRAIEDTIPLVVHETLKQLRALPE